ncbi:MAG: MBL fold metallo-hydrolase [Clostridiales bacterium]|jgi:hypothetical protein|nr:MBL fold metallo-hydrolase [Clostridiales bacterium]
MDWLEMHNMEFGECIVLGSAKRQIFMVDCGSMNVKIRETDMEVTDYLEHTLLPRYEGAKGRSFLLTHYHRDHMSGLRYLLKKAPYFFDRIYLPTAPVDRHGRALLLEFALYVFTFMGRQSEYSQVSVGALRIFERLRQIVGSECIYTLGRGSSFSFDEVQYDVLWPAWEQYPYSNLFCDIVEQLDVCMSSPYLGGNAPAFLRLKQEFCEEYVRCCELCSEETRGQPLEIEQSIDRLQDYLDQLEDLSDSLCLLPTAPDVQEILNRPDVRNEYSNAQNTASVVFHNHRNKEASYDDILMTGDATPETFDAIAEDLYDGYYIFKAPHHGTAGSWSHVFQDIYKSHILISNGDYHAAGMVCAEYQEDEGIKHCANPYACAWFVENECCCNRTAYCFEYSDRGALTLRCPKCLGKARAAQCGIYVVSYRSERGCLCDQ